MPPARARRRRAATPRGRRREPVGQTLRAELETAIVVLMCVVRALTGIGCPVDAPSGCPRNGDFRRLPGTFRDGSDRESVGVRKREYPWGSRDLRRVETARVGLRWSTPAAT